MFVGDQKLVQTVNNLDLTINNTKNIVFLLFDKSSTLCSLDRYLKSYQPHQVFLFVLGESKDITLNEIQSFVKENKLKGFLEVDITSKKSVKNGVLWAMRRPKPVRLTKAPSPVKLIEAHQQTIQTSCCSIL